LTNKKSFPRPEHLSPRGKKRYLERIADDQDANDAIDEYLKHKEPNESFTYPRDDAPKYRGQ
jgi:hypothetical protein